MARFTTQRKVSGIMLYVLTFAWLAAWIFGWLDGNQDLAEPAFYLFWVFLAASLVFMGIRGSIEE